MNGLTLFIAHPDDEVFCSGLLCAVTQAGVPVSIVCFTSGEGGTLGYPPVATRDSIADVRRGEMLAAASVIFIADVTFLGYVDPVPSGRQLKAPVHDPDTLRRDIRHQIDRTDPAVVLTHGPTGEYGHPAHVALHGAVADVMRSGIPTDIEFYSFGAFDPAFSRFNSPPRTDWLTVRFDSTDYLDTRTEMLLSHRSQRSVFVGELDSDEEYEEAVRLWFSGMAVENYCRHEYGLAPRRRSDALMRWVNAPGPALGAAEERIRRVYFGSVWALRPVLRGLNRLVRNVR